MVLAVIALASIEARVPNLIETDFETNRKEGHRLSHVVSPEIYLSPEGEDDGARLVSLI